MVKFLTLEWRNAIMTYNIEKILYLLKNTDYECLKKEFDLFVKRYLIIKDHDNYESEMTINVCETILRNIDVPIISEELFYYAKTFEQYHNYGFIDLFLNYSKDESEETCYICLSGCMKFELTNQICNCSYNVHLSCIKKYIDKLNKNGDTLECSICEKKYKIENINSLEKIYQSK